MVESKIEGATITDSKRCPICDEYGGTKVEYVDRQGDVIDVVKTCEKCGNEYVLSYGNPYVRDVTIYDNQECDE